MKPRDYWRECIADAAQECGATLTPEQLDSIADAVVGAHENYGMAFYSPPADEYQRSENDRLQRELSAERDKIPCPVCKGKKFTVTPGPYHSVVSRCGRCGGEGKCAP